MAKHSQFSSRLWEVLVELWKGQINHERGSVLGRRSFPLDAERTWNALRVNDRNQKRREEEKRRVRRSSGGQKLVVWVD